MTSFNSLETSVESSQPQELFRLVLGSTVFLYTSGDEDVTIGADTYEREAIGRSILAQGVKERAKVVSVTVPSSNPFVQPYKGSPTGDTASVSIFRMQRGELPTIIPILQFKGTVASVGFPKNASAAVIQVRSVEGTLGKTIPRYTFAGPCQRVLYDGGCGVDPLAFSVTDTVTSVAGNVITLPAASAKVADYFRSGFCQLATGGDFRMITAHAGSTITLRSPFRVDVTGQSLKAFAGCNHTFGAGGCLDFANRPNFGGFPWVPNKNPFITGTL